MAWDLLARLKQALRAANRRRLRRRRAGRRERYSEWVAQYDTIGPEQRTLLQARLDRLDQLTQRPLISVLMPTYNPPREFFEAAIASVRAQLYPNWELCIADDASTSDWLTARLAELQREEPRIRAVRREANGHICAASNSAMELARGDWLALLDHDDLLAEHALLVVAETAAHFPDAGLIYSDEDKIGPGGDGKGEREDPSFKPDWDPDFVLSCNMVCHLAAVRADVMRQIGGFRLGFEGAQDHDLVLRCSEVLRPDQIVHIPQVLYHWRVHAQSTAGGAEVKPYASEAGRRAVESHLQRRGIGATVSVLTPGRYRVHWPAPTVWPRVSVIIPTKNQQRLLAQCLNSLTTLTDYPDLELVIVDNGSDEADALALLEQWSRRPNVKLLRAPGPFNYAALNNDAAAQATGEVLVLMNNDIEIVEAGWLREMVSQALRPGVGAVGAKLLYPDRTVQHAGVILGIDRGDGLGGVAAHAHSGIAANAGGYLGRAALAQTFSAVTAACLAVQRRHFEAVRGLDAEHLAVAYNDVDFCLRLREQGLRNVWTPFALLLHHESASRGRDVVPKNMARFLAERGHMLQRWGATLPRDPAYNPNLSIQHADFSPASPPRLDWSRPWFEHAPTATGASA